MAEFQPVVVERKSNPWIKRIIFVVLILAVVFGTYFLISKFSKKKLYNSQNVAPMSSNMAFPSISSDEKSISYFDQANRALVAHTIVDNKDSNYPCAFLPEGGQVTNAKWSSDQKNAYIFWTNEDITKVFFTDIINKKNVELNSGIVDIDFMGDKAVYIFNKDENYSLNTSDLNGKNYQNLSAINSVYMSLQPSVDKSKILLWGMGTDGEKSLAVYNISSKTIKEIDSGLIFFAQFSPDGNKILYSKIIDSQSHLYVTDQSKITDLKAADYPGQLVWAGNDSVIVVTFENAKNGTNFVFYKENVNDLKKKEINRLTIDSENDPYYLAISQNQKTLYFINNGSLQKVSL